MPPRRRTTASRASAKQPTSLPLSSSEPLYSNLVYGSPEGINNNNCYAYAIGQYDDHREIKLQPGQLAGNFRPINLGNCNSLRRRSKEDLERDIYEAGPEDRCRPGFYKIMSFISKGSDFHWYKQHRDVLYRTPKTGGGQSRAQIAKALGIDQARIQTPGDRFAPDQLVLVRDVNLWSHKRGFGTGPLLKDACGKYIKDPRTACRDYGKGYDYATLCGTYCVRKNDDAPPPR